MPLNSNKMCFALCHRFRLRKKTWKNPGTVFLDYHVYEEDINISSNLEVFLEVLEGEVNMLLLHHKIGAFGSFSFSFFPNGYILNSFNILSLIDRHHKILQAIPKMSCICESHNFCCVNYCFKSSIMSCKIFQFAFLLVIYYLFGYRI